MKNEKFDNRNSFGDQLKNYCLKNKNPNNKNIENNFQIGFKKK